MDKFRIKMNYRYQPIAKKVTRRSLFDKTAIISYSTPNYQQLTKIFRESLLRLCNNKSIYHKLDYPPEHLMKNTGFRTNLWYYCVHNKIKHLIETLKILSNSQYELFIYSDCDIWFLPAPLNQWNDLEERLINPITFMREGETNDVNTGFFIIQKRYLGDVILFFEKVSNLMSTTQKEAMPYGDQTIINQIRTKIDFGYLPNEYVIWGKLIFDNHKALLHHCVCCNSVAEKIKQISFIKDSLSRSYH